MSVEGLCQICEAAPADNQCSRCAALVCTDHYDGETGFCIDCAREVRASDADQ